MSEPVSENWRHQMQLAAEARAAASTPHHHCRKGGASRVNRGLTEASPEQSPRTGDDEERNRAPSNGELRRQDWDAMDLSGQGLRALSPSLFGDYTFLGRLFIDNNRLTHIPSSLGQLRNLSHLDASNNQIMDIPEEIGMLVNLKSLLLFDNDLRSLPCEIGYLYKLEMLGIDGNPLDEGLKEEIVQKGTRALVTHLRETTAGEFGSSADSVPTNECLAGSPPNDRDWHILDETPASETLSVLSYNILCDKYATTSQYGYTPSGVLSWDYRKDIILGEIKEHDTDIICLQEVDMERYNEFFRRELASNDYRGVFYPKTRAKTMADKEAKFVDGCATFFKNSKYICLEKHIIEFANTAINRPDMKGEHDTFNRVMPRDHIAVVTFFENRHTGSRMIVVNAHIYWDPAFNDVKLIQVAILMEQVTMLADRWATYPPSKDAAIFRHPEANTDTDSSLPEEAPVEPSPSLEYSSGTQIPLLICGDFNSAAGSGVNDLITLGSVSADHADLANRSYGKFTKDGMSHPFKLKSAYTDELSFTNYTPDFSGVVDYIFYSHNVMQVRGVLGKVEPEYLSKVPGFPNHHFPSDHLALRAEFSIKARKDRKGMETESGSQKERRI